MYVRDNNPHFLEESCRNWTLSTMRESCLDIPETKVDDIARTVLTKKKNDDSNQDNNNEAENIVVDEEDEGNTNNKSDDKSNPDECVDECLNVGDIFWGKHGRVWYAAVVAALEDVPKNICQYFIRQ